MISFCYQQMSGMSNIFPVMLCVSEALAFWRLNKWEIRNINITKDGIKLQTSPTYSCCLCVFLYRHMGVCSCSLLPINISGNTHATDFDVVDVFCVCQFRNFISEMWNSAKMSWMLLWSRSWGAVALYLSYIHYMLYRRDEQYYLKCNVALCI